MDTELIPKQSNSFLSKLWGSLQKVMSFFAPGREPHPPKRQGRGREKESGVVRARRALRESASPVKVHQKKDITEKVGFFAPGREPHPPKGKKKRGGEAIARCSCEGSARRLAEGAPSGFRQKLFISTIP